MRNDPRVPAETGPNPKAKACVSIHPYCYPLLTVVSIALRRHFKHVSKIDKKGTTHTNVKSRPRYGARRVGLHIEQRFLAVSVLAFEVGIVEDDVPGQVA